MHRSVAGRLAIVVVVAAGYAPFLGGEALTDDFVHLQHATQNGGSLRVLTSADLFGFYRPLPQASYALEQRGSVGVLDRRAP